ncbi:uncharacterized protein LOC132704348 [Cylas formicarius]|uniref:uncharacterized protein LOC132704348 n=1 Tax=Cylas formicarius TaxID=197179 RepID=UPI002958D4E9|nr:uncharacterized protein LOC132704348 [Cylas formicarius]
MGRPIHQMDVRSAFLYGDIEEQLFITCIIKKRKSLNQKIYYCVKRPIDFLVTDKKTLETALEVGYRHFDTAYVYGNEHIIGKVLNKWFSSGKLKRDDVFITTKLPFHGAITSVFHNVEKFLKESLAAPQMNYVDLYLVHSPIRMRGRCGGVDGLSMDHVGVWREMEKQVKAGRAKTIGVSNFNQRQVERLLKEAEIKPVCNQIELNVYLPQTQLMEFLQANGIVVVSFYSLGSSRPIERRDKIGLPQTAARSSGISSPCTRRLTWLYLCNMPNKKYINV